MSYNSEVLIKCEKKAYEDLKVLCYALEPDNVWKDGEYIIFYWSSVEWNWFSNIMVQIIGETLEELDRKHDMDANDHLGYAFGRIGENCGDIEVLGNDIISTDIIRKFDIPDDLPTYTEEKEV